MSFKHIQVPPEWILYFIHILASSKERCVFILYGTLPIIMLSRALDLRHRLCRVMQLTFSRSVMPENITFNTRIGIHFSAFAFLNRRVRMMIRILKIACLSTIAE